MRASSLLLLLLAAPAAADVLTTAYTLPLTPTAVDTVVPVERFDPAIGELEHVVVCLAGVVERRLAAENTSAQPAPVTFSQIREHFRLALPGDDPLTHPLLAIEDVAAPFTTSLGAFDGGLDYGGASGFDTGVLRSTVVAELDITAGRLLSRFEGSGPLNLGLRADGTTVVGGPSNMEALSETAVAVRVVVLYDYRPALRP